MKDFLYNLRQKFQTFMIGRYGSDQLNQFLCGVFLVMIVLNIFVHSRIIYTLEFLPLFLIYFRMFSRNISQRFKENQKYMDYRFYVTEWFKKLKFRANEAKTYHIYKCPSCGQKIRIPRGRGKVQIRCPKCGTEFIKKS